MIKVKYARCFYGEDEIVVLSHIESMAKKKKKTGGELIALSLF
jgi:hypothetical protein